MGDVGGCELGAEVFRDVALAVVGHHAFDGDAVGGEEGPGPAPKADGGNRPLVVVDLRVGQPGVGVNGGVAVGIAKAGAPERGRGRGGAPSNLVTPPGGIWPVLTSTWTSSPGRVVSIRRMTRPERRSRSGIDSPCRAQITCRVEAGTPARSARRAALT